MWIGIMNWGKGGGKVSQPKNKRLNLVNGMKAGPRLLVIILFVLILFAGLVGGVIFYVKSALKPVDEEGQQKVAVEIPIGSSVIEIAKILEKNGAIKSALVFRYYVKYKNETGFQAGNYELTTTMDVPEIVSELKEGRIHKDAAMRLTIPEGYNLSAIARTIAEKTDYTKEEVIDKLQDKEFVESLTETYSMLTLEDITKEGIKYSLEGYLFPATYAFDEESPSLDSIIREMVEKMQSVVDRHADDIEQSGYSVHELMTLASLIETETQKSEDRYKVSGVFHNRLENEMRLDSDPTVKYALDKTDIQVTYKDTDVTSPYNTYRMIGIPIGPIASPREESIKAALHPKTVDELYFFARPNGQVIYTKTLNEHEKVVTTYRHEWNTLIEEQKSAQEN